jgi:phenylacetate-coenzyme A ligase PaaK-like adenylate-forming protein
MDTSVYRERIRAMWGEYPREGYGCSEFGFIANQHYAGVGMVPNVKTCYLEFLEMDDYAKWKHDRSYRPRLLLLSEVQVGRDYALVGTNFFGGVLVRYLLGDAVRFLSLRDPGIGLQLPQMMVSSRIDDVIDIAGFTRLTEKTVWSAVEGCGLRYVDWVVAKEFKSDQPVLHLYLEPRADGHDPEQARRAIHEELKRLDPQYKDLEEMAGIRPLVVTLFSRGTFQRYQKERQAAGYDIAHLKPPHMNPRPEVIARLVSMSAIRI